MHIRNVEDFLTLISSYRGLLIQKTRWNSKCLFMTTLVNRTWRKYYNELSEKRVEEVADEQNIEEESTAITSHYLNK